jgi:two-component system sensor histidine kinase/response regulator
MHNGTTSAGSGLVNETLREMMRNSEDYLFVKDTALVYHGGSDVFARLTSAASAAELPGKTDYELFPRPIAEKYRADDRTVLESGEPMLDFVERLPDLDGRERWTRTRKFPIRDDSGRIIGLYGVSRDISREKLLAESRDSLAETLLNTDLQFFTYYPDRKLCENPILNRRFSQLPTVWEHYPDDFLAYAHCLPEDEKAYREMVAAIDRGEDSAGCTVRFSYRDSLLWEKITMRAVRGPDGKTIRAQGHSVDVTKKLREADRLREERVRLKTMEGGIFESFSFDLSRADKLELQTRDDAMARAEITPALLAEALRVCPALESAGARSREVLLKAASRIPDADDRALFISTCSGNAMREGVRNGHYSAEIRYRRYVGSVVRWVETNAEVLPDPESGDLIAFYYTKDITEAAVRERISRALVERNYACVSTLDLQTGIFTVVAGTDRELAGVSGRPYEDALQTAARDFVAQEDAACFLASLSREAILAGLARQPTYTFFNRRRKLAESLPGRPQRRMKHDVFYLDAHRDTLVFLLSDVTAIFEQERETRGHLETALLAAQQASSAKSNFLSRMSHEIRTPLNAIIGMDTIAAQSMGDPQKAADCIAKIGLSARYLLSLINDILDMSRIESGKMLLKNESFTFQEFIAGVNNIIYPQVRAKGIEYECTVSGELADSYLGDEMKLQQVLVNVLGNAVKFTSRGKISLDVSVLSREGKREKLRFVVGDTGCGIAEGDLGRIFDAFEQVDTTTTTVFGGTGLGLAITKNLVNLMGGIVNVRSIVGVGSEFTIDVPLTADETALRLPKFQPNLQNLHTLIVDDDLLICEQTEKILREIGMAGEWVTSGGEAVERVRGKAADGKYFDFILIDWKMPDMDGIETTQRIRRIAGPDVTIIIISAYDWQSIEAQARAAGANMMVSKPLLRSTLVSAFERALGSEPDAEKQRREFDFTGRRVLLAEDNDLNAEIARTLLENKHFAVDRVPNGLRALERFVQSPAGTYDAILMDVRMPMMDGLQATVNIRHWDRPDAGSIPIIAMTANAFDEDMEKSRAAGMNAHLSKPIDPELMYGTLAHLISHQED